MDLYEQWKQLESKEQWKLYNSTVLKMICTGSIIRILFTAFNGELASSFSMQVAAVFTMTAPIVIHALNFVQSRGRNYVIFLIFQVYQFLNVLYAVSKNTDQFGPILLFSTVMCITLEVSWFYNRWVTLLVVNKHFFVWLFAWKDIIKSDTSWWSILTFPTIGYILYMNMMVWGNHGFFTTMSYERFLAQRSAEQRWEFIESIVRSVQTGIIVLNAKLQVQLVNNSLMELLALREAVEVLPKLQGLVYGEETKAAGGRLMQDVERLALDSSELSIDLGLTQVETRVLDWKATKVHLSHEELLILTCSDITDYIRLQRVAKDENAAKTVLLRTVTHELRTPLNAVINVATDLIEKEDVPVDMKNQLSILRTSGQLMLFVTNDLLDFSQLMAGKLRLHFESFEIRKLVAEVTSLLHFQAEKKTSTSSSPSVAALLKQSTPTRTGLLRCCSTSAATH